MVVWRSETFAFSVMLSVTLFTAAQGLCGAPPTFHFAVLDQEYFGIESFPADSTVTYQCLPGYSKIPRSFNRITCYRSSKWSQVPDFCQRKSCGSPGELLNGRVDLEDALFGSTATFSCDEGYRLVGRAERKCQHTNTWSGAVPECEPVICVHPPEIDGGTHSGRGKDEFTYQSSVTYSCTSSSHSLIGEASIFCTENGTWSGDPPACKDLSCPGIKNGQITSGFQTLYKFGDRITFRCDYAFIMNGSNVAECGIDNKWLPKHPECLRRESCPEPAFENGEIKGFRDTFKSGLETGYKLNEYIEFFCDPGYRLIPSSANKAFCKETIHWQTQIPTCTARETCAPPKIENGNIHGDKPSNFRSEYGYRVGSFIEFSCKPGYILIGEKNSSCQMDKRWSTKIPICEARESCPEPEVNNGHVIGKPESFKLGLETGYRIHSRVTVECHPGHSMYGRKEITCGHDLKWSPPVPVCWRNTCGLPTSFDFAELKPEFIEKNIFPIGGRVSYNCRPGYRPIRKQSNSIQCLNTLAWSKVQPFCESFSPSPSIEETQEGTQGETEDCRKIPGGITALCEVVDKKANESCVEAKIESYKTIMEMKKLCLEIQKLQLEISKLQS